MADTVYKFNRKIKEGKRVRVADRETEGVIVWVHPTKRWAVVEFTLPKSDIYRWRPAQKYREAFFSEDMALIKGDA